MGNYGDTLDYWYRRAALVIRTPLADERDRFTLDFDAALAEAREMAADPACSAELAARVQAAASVLADQAARQGRSLLAAYTDIALALPDAEAAVALLQAFDPTTFEAEDAEPLARLARRHGDDRLIGLLQTWYAVADRPWQRPGPWRHHGCGRRLCPTLSPLHRPPVGRGSRWMRCSTPAWRCWCVSTRPPTQRRRPSSSICRRG